MQVLSEDERLQLRSWQDMLSSELENALAFLRVISVRSIRGGSLPFRRFRGIVLRGPLVEIGPGQVSALVSELECALPAELQAPDFAIRAPSWYAALVAHRR